MPRVNQFSPGMTVMLFVNRLVLGVYFVIAGGAELKPTLTHGVLDNMRRFAENVAKDAPLPYVLGLGYGYSIPFLEILCGVALVIGLFGRHAAWIIAVMLVSFIIGATGLKADVGSFHPNVIFLTLAILLAISGPGRISIDAATRSSRRR